MLIADKAREAAQAREELQQALLACSVVLAQAGAMLTEACAELRTATIRESAATLDYITALETELHRRDNVNLDG